jgi:phosphoesterase RecJ-like protein
MPSLPEFNRLHALVRSATKILLIADGKPDGDSLGSSSGFLNWLIREGKTAQAYCAAPIPRAFSYLDGIQLFRNDAATFKEAWDLIITFDAGDLRHCGVEQLLPQVKSTYTLVNIDHHATNARYGNLNLVYVDACSTCEVVYRFLTAEDIRLDSAIATSLLTGILTDTSSFSNSATTSPGIDAASALTAAGARTNEIYHHLLQNKTVAGLRLWGLALSRLKFNKSYNLATTYFLAKDLEGISEEAVDGVSNLLNASCGEAETILVLRDLADGKIRGSMRSAKRDISKLAKLLGGGGHKKAAGFTINGRLEETAGGVRVVSTL